MTANNQNNNQLDNRLASAAKTNLSETRNTMNTEHVLREIKDPASTKPAAATTRPIFLGVMGLCLISVLAITGLVALNGSDEPDFANEGPQVAIGEDGSDEDSSDEAVEGSSEDEAITDEVADDGSVDAEEVEEPLDADANAEEVDPGADAIADGDDGEMIDGSVDEETDDETVDADVEEAWQNFVIDFEASDRDYDLMEQTIAAPDFDETDEVVLGFSPRHAVGNPGTIFDFDGNELGAFSVDALRESPASSYATTVECLESCESRRVTNYSKMLNGELAVDSIEVRYDTAGNQFLIVSIDRLLDPEEAME